MQFLTELDGVETLTGVFVFAATRLALKAREIVVSAYLFFCSPNLDFNGYMKIDLKWNVVSVECELY